MRPNNNRFILKSFYSRLAVAQQNWIFFSLFIMIIKLEGGRAETSSALPPPPRSDYHYHHILSHSLEILTKCIKF